MTNTDKELSSSVYVGGKEPTGNDRKKVWMQKGKNLLNKKMLIVNRALNTDNGIISVITSGNYYGTEEYIPFSQYANKQISISTRMSVAFYDSTKQFISSFSSHITSSGKAPSNTAFMRCDVHKDYYNEAQIEQNPTATDYEDYIEPKIYIKNSNDVYEEFIKKSEEVYSTGEQKIGTWVDGKPLYRKVISSTLPKVITEDVGVTKIVSIDADIKTGFIEAAYFNKDNQMMPMPFIFTGGQIIKSYMGLNGTITLWSNTTYVNEQPVTIIVCYTKTTD